MSLIANNSLPVSSCPLSHVQEGMLFHSIYGADSRDAATGVYLQQFVWHLHEAIRLDDFQRAWKEVIKRHAVLRSDFYLEQGDRAVQRIYQGIFPVFEYRLQHNLSLCEQQQHLKNYLQADREQGFILTRAPLMRFMLFKFSNNHYCFVWTYHHALLDGRSRFLVLNEVFSLYDGTVGTLDEPPDYTAYVNWQRRQDFTQAKHFWRLRLDGANHSTPLPFGLPEAPDSPSHHELHLVLSKKNSEFLRSTAKQYNLTLNTLMQAGWALLLKIHSGETDIIFGATRAGRHAGELNAAEMVGVLINTLPMRVNIPRQVPILEWLQTLRGQWLEMRSHTHTPPLLMQQCSTVAPGHSLFDSILVLENYEINDLLRKRGGAWKYRRFELFQHTHYPLVLSVKNGDTVHLSLEYACALFSPKSIKKLLRQLRNLLLSLCNNIKADISRVSPLNSRDYRALIHQSNGPANAFPLTEDFTQLLSAQAKRTPNVNAVECRGQSLSYLELEHQSNQLAWFLQTQGVTAETPVAVYLPRAISLLITLLGILKSGAYYVPLDPAYPKERLQFMLKHSRSHILITETGMQTELSVDSVQTIHTNKAFQLAAVCAKYPPPPVHSQNLAYVIYTSGSSGKPKGVAISRANLLNFLLAMRELTGIKARDVLPALTTVCFDIAALEIYLPLLVGAKVVLLGDNSHQGELQRVLEHQATLAQATPATWRVLLESGWRGGNPQLKILCGGEAMERDLAQQLRRCCVQLWNVYGPTETTVWSSVCLNREDMPYPSVPIGKPIANTTCYVLDENLNLLPEGAPGNLYIAGEGTARGYFDAAGLSAAAFLPDPFSPQGGTRMYYSGDKVRRLPNGDLLYLQRTDQQIKLRGFRIEPGEIEQTLNRHPGVRRSLVALDSTGFRLLAYILPSPETIFDPKLLAEFIAQYLPAYMLPTEYISLRDFPLTPNGKIDHSSLPLPPNRENTKAKTTNAPRDLLELRVMQIWERVLQREPIGIHDNFFDIGGHSLSAMILLNQINLHCNKALPLETLFQHSTVAQLAQVLRHEQPLFSPSPICLQQGPEGNNPLFFVHPVGGGVLCYRDLAKHLGRQYGVYAFQAGGINTPENPAHSVEELAQDYVRQLRSIRPYGPYRLSGWSFGGCVAFEMACRLLQTGETVEYLALLESFPPSLPIPSPHSDDSLQRFASDLFASAGQACNIEINDWPNLMEQIKAFDILPADMPEQDLKNRYYLFRNNRHAAKHYQGKQYTGKAPHIFYCRENENAMQAWQTFSRQNICLHAVEGNHYSLIREPHAARLAKQISKTLNHP